MKSTPRRIGYSPVLPSVGFLPSRGAGTLYNIKNVLMKAIELLKISCEALKMMSKNGICLEDYKYVDAYEQFLTMRSFGMKYRSAITMLAEERHVGERTLQRAFKRLSQEC